MLSHLRFHRRGASNPATPTADQSLAWSPLGGYELLLASSHEAPLPSSPPTLPPITRVTSADADLDDGLGDLYDMAPSDARPRIESNGGATFMCGVALQNHCRLADAQLASAGPAPPVDLAAGPREGASRRQQPNAVAEGQPRALDRQPSSFTTPTELQTSTTAATGKRPAGARLLGDAPVAANAEPPKIRKSLPFLKNSMSSLLMRRKNNQNVPHLRPLPLTSPEEPVYDPRIRGTRVHDFSTPRHKHHAPNRRVAAHLSATQPDAFPARQKDSHPAGNAHDGMGPAALHLANPSTASCLAPPGALGPGTQLGYPPHEVFPARKAGSSVDQALTLADKPKSDGAGSFSHSSSSATFAQAFEANEQEPRRTHPSTRTTRSGNVILSDMSALPRHMKSTSSRFSFDMIGASKQEKLPEERHRKRELEKRSTATEPARHSRLDDLDDDSFDYDAMMGDDELEDEDGAPEEAIDPDNDQENFAGFVFQRSNPAAALSNPRWIGAAATPRDPGSKVVGAATPEHTQAPLDLPASSELQPMSMNYALSSDYSALGIRAPAGALDPKSDDDLYFDDGLINPHGEFAQDLAMKPKYDMAPFDESIFDDTEEYGRPVPGAFAQAQELRRAAVQESAVKRESDVTSRFSAHSGTSLSTAHTSTCVEAHKDGEPTDRAGPKTQQGDGIAARPPSDVEPGSVAAYQAALAAAAHQAAVSGKFQWVSSPTRDDDESKSHLDDLTRPNEASDDGVFGPAYDDMDDFDLEDNAIIAEANASALVNDSDEWYGQEFGFYSAPVGHHHAPHISSKGVDYEYANRGFFGPKGMSGLDRSTSGRMILREPNLTPITERSEYSNRNSLMSLGFPPLSSSTPKMQSPGLAQLAFMADRGDKKMSLSALLRLRSRAWGGSQASLGSSMEGSHLSEWGDVTGSPWNLNLAGPPGRSSSGHGRKNLFLSTASRESEGFSTSASPTVTMAMTLLSSPCTARPSPADQHASLAGSKPPPAPPPTAPAKEQRPQPSGFPAKEAAETWLSAGSRSSSSDVEGSLKGAGAHDWLRRQGMGHHRHKSSADSVSYLKEEDCGETRWIMERRRTGESGQVEILEREVVEGGRI